MSCICIYVMTSFIFHLCSWVLSSLFSLFSVTKQKLRFVVEQIFREAAAHCLRHTVLMKILQVSFLSRKSSLPHYLKSHLYRLIWLWTHLSSYSISLFFPLLISCSLSLSHSCLMRRSRTAKRMNHAEWVPAVLLCPCASALCSAVLAVIRAEANSRGSRPTHGTEKEQMIAASVTDRLLISAVVRLFLKVLHQLKDEHTLSLHI